MLLEELLNDYRGRIICRSVLKMLVRKDLGHLGTQVKCMYLKRRKQLRFRNCNTAV